MSEPAGDKWCLACTPTTYDTHCQQQYMLFSALTTPFNMFKLPADPEGFTHPWMQTQSPVVDMSRACTCWTVVKRLAVFDTDKMVVG